MTGKSSGSQRAIAILAAIGLLGCNTSCQADDSKVVGLKRLRAFDDTHVADVIALAISPDGKHVVSADRDFRLIHLTNVATGRHVAHCTYSNVQNVSFSPDGNWIALAGDTVALWSPKKAAIRILWNREVGQSFGMAAFSPDGRLLAGAGSANRVAGEVFVWEVRTGRVLARIKNHGRATVVTAVAFSPDGKFLISSDFFGRVIVWDVQRKRIHQRLSVSDLLKKAGKVVTRPRVVNPTVGTAGPVLHGIRISKIGNRIVALVTGRGRGATGFLLTELGRSALEN